MLRKATLAVLLGVAIALSIAFTMWRSHIPAGTATPTSRSQPSPTRATETSVRTGAGLEASLTTHTSPRTTGAGRAATTQPGMHRRREASPTTVQALITTASPSPPSASRPKASPTKSQPARPGATSTTRSLTTATSRPKVVSGRWVQIGPDGGDMHFVYVTRNHVLFASHGFGGVWRSVNGGESWDLVYNEEFINTNFMAMGEVDGVLYAGGNNGLWRSFDEGLTWEKVVTGNDDIDFNRKYEVTSVIPLSVNEVLFSVTINKGAYKSGFRVPRHGFFILRPSGLKFIEVPERASAGVVVMLGYDSNFSGREVVFVSSSDAGLYTYDMGSGRWFKILSRNTTRVSVDTARDVVYVGTIGDWYYMGYLRKGSWVWEHITVPGKKCAVASFITPDPYNPRKLWFGAVGGPRGTPYRLPPNTSGASFIGVGFWVRGRLVDIHLTGNWATMVAIDRHQEGEDEGYYTIDTPYGKAARIAYVPQAGRGNIRKTEDGGITWRRAYNGIYADTINSVSYISSGVRAGDLVVTCVSGIQISNDLGVSWEEGIDFTIGRVAGELPGYAWGAASPPAKLEGRYDLLIATGYPPTTLKGNGVYAVDTECIKSGGRGCVKRLTKNPSYSIVIVGNVAYIGRMDSGVDVLDLKTYEVRELGGIPPGEAGMNILYSNGYLFVSTERGGNRDSDNYFFTNPRGIGGIYVCGSDGCREIYHGRRVVSFSVRGRELVALTVDSRLLYFKDYEEGVYRVVRLPRAIYSDMVIDWRAGIIYLSTFNPGTYGVMYADLDNLREGLPLELKPLVNGLLTDMVRDLELANGVLIAGTEGYSAWRLVPSYG